jgi:hypothetical protein
MKIGKSLTGLAAEIERQAAAKRDIVATTNAMHMAGGNTISVNGHGDFGVTDHTHRQIQSRLKIDARYYDRMRAEDPELLDYNVNRWFDRKPERRMLRTMTLEKPVARAFLSNRYRRLDNVDLALALLPELAEVRDLQLISCDITDVKLYLKFTTPRVQGEVKKGDIVQAGAIISNSEIGQGSVNAFPFLNRLACLNGMVVEEFGQRKYHTGRASEGEEEAYEVFADETLKADDRAFWLKVRDTVRAVLQQVMFDKLLDRMRESSEQKIDGDVPQVVEVLSNKFALNEAEKGSVLRHLIGDGIGLNAWGLMNAVTSVAGEVESYDRATELETVGGRILSLAPGDWKEIATAKA